MEKLILVIYLLISTYAFAEIPAESFVIPYFKPEIISSEHIRYEIEATHPTHKDLVINLQIKDFTPEDLWSEANYQEEVQFALKTRKTIAFFLGLNDYQIISHQFKNGDYPIQMINGSFTTDETELSFFKEINIYHSKKFYQYKIYSKTPIKDDDILIENIIKSLKNKLERSL